MLRILMLPFVLLFSLVSAIIMLPFLIYGGYKLNKIDSGAKNDEETLAAHLDKETGCTVCRLCLNNGNFRLTPAPERHASSIDPNCWQCGGTGSI